MKSPKTTISAILLFVSAAATAVVAYMDGDPATVPDWGYVVALAIAAFGLFSARDNDVSSEAAGIK